MRFSRFLVVAMVFGLALFAGPTQLAFGATLTVNSTADTTDGVCDLAPDCTLREAILVSNASAATFDTISFAGLGAGTHTLTFLSALPTITDPVSIDGSTATSYAGAGTPPKIVLDGTGLPAGTDGLKITAGDSDVIALAIVNFLGDGIELATGDANLVVGSYIGVDPDGTTAKGNGRDGILIVGSESNVIGSLALGGNVISANTREGVELSGTGATLNVVRDNKIGTNAAGTAAVPNTLNGVRVIDAPSNTIGPDNVISGNEDSGVRIRGATATLNTVLSNRIGTNAAGTAAIPNGTLLFPNSGVTIFVAPSNTIGPGNVISGNTGDGVVISTAGATGNTVKDNKIGTNAAGTAAIPNAFRGVNIFHAASNTIGPDNVISGNSDRGVEILGADSTGNTVVLNKIGTNAAGAAAIANLTGGIFLSGAVSNTIGPSNVISGNTLQGVLILGPGATLNAVAGNHIGVNLAGDTAIPNTVNGVHISGAPKNTIGPGNVISGNTSDGVRLSFAGATLNTVAVNHIGVNLAGDAAIPNGSQGVEITGPTNTIGPGNVISGNTSDGIIISGASATLNVVKDNKIGTNLAGTTAIANLGGGVFISAAPSNTIGPGNVISGNTLDGVFILGAAATGNTVSGNEIGTNAVGTAAVANLERGVRILSAPSNTIGPGNVISGNTLSGLAIDGAGATLNTVSDNKIGTNLAGTAAIANVLAGVFITGGAPSNTIGPDNVIAFNSLDGVRINGAAATGNTVTGNSIHDNTAFGINNVAGGNTELTPPTVTAAGSASGSSSCSSCTIEVFSDASDEGETFHGTTTTAAGACPCAWSFTGAVTGPNITATVTDGSGNTSEFSVPFVADTDGDGVLDANDNCPLIATVWIVPLNDPDCDGFNTTDENFYGTDPLNACAANTTPNNEPEPDKWPVDLNDSKVVTTADVGFMIVPLNAIGPGLPYTQRLDFNKDGKITTADVGFFITPLNQTCPS